MEDSGARSSGAPHPGEKGFSFFDEHPGGGRHRWLAGPTTSVARWLVAGMAEPQQHLELGERGLGLKDSVTNPFENHLRRTTW